MPQNIFDDKSSLVQVMAWCRQTTSRYLSQCWTRFMSPYGVTKPQWVNRLPVPYSDIIWRHRTCSALDPREQSSLKLNQNINILFQANAFERLLCTSVANWLTACALEFKCHIGDRVGLHLVKYLWPYGVVREQDGGSQVIQLLRWTRVQRKWIVRPWEYGSSFNPRHRHPTEVLISKEGRHALCQV